MKRYYTRIEFWIIIFFLIRLVGITNPPLEMGHSWRQITGLMVSRNFLEVDANILYPRIDDGNGGTGIIGMEFPSMNYLYFLTAKIFGYTHWYGRLINLLVSSLGLFFFYKLLRKVDFDERIAFISTILLAVSIWFRFSRKMMPDTYCISIMFIGIYYGIAYLKEKKLHQIILYMLLCSLAVLSKIPAGIYFVIPGIYLLNKHIAAKQKWILIAATIPSLVLTYWWYFVWDVELSKKFGNWFNLGKPIGTGFSEIMEHYDEALNNFFVNSFSGYLLGLVFVIGLVFIFIKKDKKMMIAFFPLFIVFLVYIFKSGFFFYHHSYYIIPFVPVMALISAYALSLIKNKWVVLILLVAGAGESIANQQHDFFTKESEKYKMTIEPLMEKYVPKTALIVLNGNENPQLNYLSHRKGWNCFDNQLSDSSYINKIVAARCEYMIVDMHSNPELNQLNLPYIKVFENEDFMIFKIGNPTN